MFNHNNDDLVRCPHCGHLLPDYEMEYTSYGEYLCPDCYDDLENEDE